MELVLIERSEGNVVAVAGRYAALQDKQERDYSELQEAIEYMIAKQSRLLAAMERKQKLMNGVPDDIQKKFLKRSWCWMRWKVSCTRQVRK